MPCLTWLGPVGLRAPVRATKAPARRGVGACSWGRLTSLSSQYAGRGVTMQSLPRFTLEAVGGVGRVRVACGGAALEGDGLAGESVDDDDAGRLGQ